MSVVWKILRVILAIPALIIAGAAKFLALTCSLAIAPVTNALIIGSGYLASIMSSALVIGIIIGAVNGDWLGFIKEYWYVWAIAYGIAAIFYLLAFATEWIAVGLDALGDWLLMTFSPFEIGG